MNLDIEQVGKGPIEIFHDIPQALHPYLITSGQPVGIRGQHFNALMQAFHGEGFTAWFNCYWMQAPVVLRARGDVTVLELRIALHNTIEGDWDNFTEGTLPECHFQLGFTPHVATRAVFQGSQEYQTFDIHFELSFLETIGLNYALLDHFITHVYKNRPAELLPYPFRCTPRMKDNIYAILRNHYSPAGKQWLLRTAVAAILMEALEEVCKEERTLPILKSTEVEKLHAVRALIAADCPLYRGNDKLCRATGLNEFILSQGFRQLFQTTPYDYFLELRFEKGKELLRQGWSVVSVAHALEYAAANPFIAKFKAKFGYTPKEFQKRGL